MVDLRPRLEEALTLIPQLRAARPEFPVIAFDMVEAGAPAIIEVDGGGASHCLSGPCDFAEMARKIIQSILNARPRAPVPSHFTATHNPHSSLDCPVMIGQSEGMRELFLEIGRIARFDLDVLLLGETGTGKELVAKALHYHSQRSQGRFIAVNCPGIPDTLFISELFGAERGAFTGADRLKIGWFERAKGGTLFLDEIGDLSLACQATLLRALQEKTISRVGSRELISVVVRVIAATNRNLPAAIQNGTFRRDLYHRLERYFIRIPPLRQRDKDIHLLVKYFLDVHRRAYGLGHCGFDLEAIEVLRRQPWPGNVRELENVVLQALMSARGATVTRATIIHVLTRKDMGSSPGTMSDYIAEVLSRARRGSLEVGALAHLSRELERELFSQAIRLAQGNQSEMARWLGVSRNTLRERLRGLQLA